ncbi:hypothetical protein OG321_42145 [Streptomyces sp. NBC_00424]|uniref:hypothetical protein n=1 Tax=Streptomyces sp. NBC_00424 TaxID=2903648 RepID=UPI0022545A88|nr:hypothetical protein [Streptomyces sp. NBC_00424]MCX5079001.1 hypothetical protein [Streptomyces sp. NBC_00424]
MSNEWVEPGARRRGAFTDEQLTRAREAAAQDAASSRGQIAARLALGEVCAETVEQSDGFAVDALTPLAVELGYAPRTLVRYLQVTKSAGGHLRERLISSTVQVTWVTLRTACVANQSQRDFRVDVLLSRLDAAESKGLLILDNEEYVEALGLEGRLPSADEAESMPPMTAPDLDASMAVVVQAIADNEAGQEKFVHALVQEGGLEALETVSAGLRKARAHERQWERDEYEQPLTEQELLLRAVLKVSRALEQPLGFEPAAVVAALPLDQFEAVDRICRSVGEWHKRLLAAAGNVAKGQVA